MLPELPPEFAATRGAMHGLAEHVVAAAYFRAAGRIGLRASPRGFATPVFGDAERVRVDGTALVHERAGATRRHQLTTIAAAAAFLGIEPGAPDVYEPATAPDPDAPLALERESALVLAEWFSLGAALLDDLRAVHPASATEPTLWPEHFDIACQLGDEDAGTRGNFGASPGDGAIGEPYLYVGPHSDARRTGALGTHPWGTAITYGELRASGAAGAAGRTFLESAAAELLGG
jgi:hypothetical protein